MNEAVSLFSQGSHCGQLHNEITFFSSKVWFAIQIMCVGFYF